MKRRKFLQQTTLGASAICTVSSALTMGYQPGKQHQPQIVVPVSKTQKPLAIAMWDFSWILRHHRYGEFENWDKILSELAHRGYNAIRIDAMPQFVVSTRDGKITDEFRSIKKNWKPALWGNDYSLTFHPREALLEFLPLCREYGIRVGLASWFSQHNTTRQDIFTEKGGLLRAWTQTLTFLQNHNLLDNIIYVDLLNEYPNWHGYDWIKQELNKRSDIKKFMFHNPDVHLPDMDVEKVKSNALQILFANQFMKETINTLKTKFPLLEFFTSYDSSVQLDDINISGAALDYHVWFQHKNALPSISEISSLDQSLNLRSLYKNLYSYWTEHKTELVKWMDERINSIAQKATENKVVCGNTEGWGPIRWYDHPELSWQWTKEAGDICVELARKHDNYKFICSSNFTHPQFKGIWEDIGWHKRITDKIKA